MPNGLDPFDSRFLGYSAEDARSYIAALARAGGTDTYLGVFRTLDTVFPLALTITFLGTLWLNTASLGLPLRMLLLFCPLLYLVADLLENAQVAAMLIAGPEGSATFVEKASRMTQIKWFGVAVSLAAMTATWGHRRMRGES